MTQSDVAVWRLAGTLGLLSLPGLAAADSASVIYVTAHSD